MKMKKLLAGVLAGAMTLSAVTFTSLTLSAADEPSEKILYEVGQLSQLSVGKSYVENATTSITITVDGIFLEGGVNYIFAVPVDDTDWAKSICNSSPLTISTEKLDDFKNGLNLFKLNEAYSKINTITLKVDNQPDVDLYNIKNDIGTHYDNNGYPNGEWAQTLKITPEIITELGVENSDGLKRLKFNAQISAKETGAFIGVHPVCKTNGTFSWGGTYNVGDPNWEYGLYFAGENQSDTLDIGTFSFDSSKFDYKSEIGRAHV